MKVLLVEDDSLVRELLPELLASRGHAVVTAGTAEDALSLLSTAAPPAVIVLDLMLPGMCGEEFLDRLSERHDLDGVRVVIATALSNRHQHPRAAALLVKPYTVDEIDAAVLGMVPVSVS